MAAALMACAVVAGAVWVIWSLSRPGPIRPGTTLAELMDAIERGQPNALARAKQLADRQWPQSRQAVQAMLSHDSWRMRAAACEILTTGRPGGEQVGVLVARCSDSDWRVRAVAFAGLSRVRPLPASAALRDAPLDSREQMLLAWLDAYDAKSADGLRAQLCELYADIAHTEVGRPIAAGCLRCHAGARPATFAAGDACARCHRQIHTEWAGSAHAQSLSHLRLTTIDPDWRQPEPMDFGEVRGLSCLECHRPDPSQRPISTASTGPARACPFKFDRAAPPGKSCQRCHATTFGQWQAWREGRQPRRADWPPGQLDLDFRGDKRTCVDCHMRPASAGGGRGLPEHRWAARRDAQLLREGVDVRVVPAGGDGGERKARLVLTNLSGHAYPTGTRRRAVRIYAGPASREEPGLIAAICPVRPGRVWSDTQPSLAPGEQRSYLLSLPVDTAGVAYRLVYWRDQHRSDSQTSVIFSGAAPVGR